MSDMMRDVTSIIAATPIFSTHEHHREDHFQTTLNLDKLFANSYVGWYPLPADNSHTARSEWIQARRSNTYFIWLEKALCDIYNVAEVSASNWDELSQKISKAHANPTYHMTLLREKAGYIRFLEDCYWNPASDVGHPEMTTPVYRIDMWLSGFHPESGRNGCNPRQQLGQIINDFETYENLLEADMRQKRPGIAGLKCAIAYERTIQFSPKDREAAKAAFGRHPDKITEAERKAFGDYMMHRCLELAEELSLPVQFHTGLAKLHGSNPMNLESLIAAYPRVKFVLFHGGFPWIYEIAGLAHNYGNIVLDLNWLPLISTTAAKTALQVYLDVMPDGRNLTWGGDTWTSEEAIGAVKAFQFTLASTLSERMAGGLLRASHAEWMIAKIMHKNAQDIYQI